MGSGGGLFFGEALQFILPSIALSNGQDASRPYGLGFNK